MENNKYLDKVIGSLVRGTDIDYGKRRIYYPFSTSITLSSPYLLFFPTHLSSYRTPPFAFSDYCENQFGLTEEEIKYVFKQYKDIIKDKIKDGE